MASKGRRSRPEPAKRSAPLHKRLPEYEAKRDFSVTTEPAPGVSRPRERPAFVVHKHDASRLHYDVRLEMDSALASWSVPRGPSYDPSVKRLAIQTEDHPLEYGSFEGRIPDGEYGAGDSLIWDKGFCDSVPPGQLSQQRKKGHIVVNCEGQKLRGQWHLIRTHGGAPGKAQWLMFKAKDGTEDPSLDIVAERPESVVSGRIATRGPERQGTLRAPRPAPEALLEGMLPPMLATLVEEPPASPDYLIETKYDGYRALCALSNRRVAMWTRNGLDLTARFSAIARALSQIVVGDAVLDGEIAVLDTRGVSRFELLQQGHADEAILFAFDLLRLDGADLRGRPLLERRDLMFSLLSNSPAPLALSEELQPPTAAALEETRRRGGEGLVLKARRSVYKHGRSRDWLKVKALATQELAIMGWVPGKGAAQGAVGALLLAVAEGDGFVFAGKVGTGFSAKQRKELKRELEKDAVDKPAVRGAPRLRDAHWVRPRLVAQVRFTEWTKDGKLRHPTFQGLRPDKAPADCVREIPQSGAREHRVAEAGSSSRQPAAGKGTARQPRASASAGRFEVPLSNPDRLLYPKDKITKADVADYYAAVQEPLLRALADRPLALVHWNQGIERPSWFQQNIGKEREPWMTLVATPTGSGRRVEHLVVDRPEALRWLAQHSVLELHPWHSRVTSLTMPDWVVFDLDPAEGKDISQAVAIAQLLHDMFDRLSLPSVVKTTGKRGLHLLVPLAPGHTYEDATSFALKVGEMVARQVKDVTLERSKAKRHGRLYFDCLQNGYGKTIIAPYSLRGVEGAPVSAPLKWSEVVPGLDPRRFNLRTMPARLAEVGDLFAPALAQGVRLPRFER